MKLAALSVDLDEIPCYAAIHGLPTPEGATRHAIYERALPRFEAFFGELGIAATFFAVGRDLERPQVAQALQRLHAAGHEIANHSHQHRYDFSRQPPEAMARDIGDGAGAIEAAIGQRPRGFRAPGYVVNDALFEILQSQGYLYDSSVFPCPSYYGAKAAAIAAIALRGRRSHSLFDTPRVLLAPTDPYRVGKHYPRRGKGLLELPIGVTHLASGRLPYIGTSLVLGGAPVARWLSERILGRPLVNLELHGIDLADAEADGLQALRPHQPDLRRALDFKWDALVAAVQTLRGDGYAFVTLEQAALAFA